MINIDPIDKELGNNLRFLRLIRGLTQSEVGEILGVTFQQVQKYEQGTNRITARTLCKLKCPLGVEFQDFFNPLAEVPLVAITTEQDKTIISMIRHFVAIPSPQQKRIILNLIRELSEEMER